MKNGNFKMENISLQQNALLVGNNDNENNNNNIDQSISSHLCAHLWRVNVTSRQVTCLNRQVEILGKTKVTKTSNDTFMTWAGWFSSGQVKY